MNIYTQKQNWKIALGAAAIVIVIASLAYTNYLIKQIANDERSKIRIWAEAIQKKARLVKYTNELFDKIKSEERKRVQIWAEASKMLTISESSADLNFYLNVLDNNTTIPVILADDKGNITSWKNIDGVENNLFGNLTEKQKNKLLSELQKMRAQQDSILIPLRANSNNVIFYSESKLFNELRFTLDDLIKSFITEVVNNYASVPVLITDGSKKIMIASGNLGNEDVKDKASLDELIAKMSKQNLPIAIDLGAGEKNYIFYQDSSLLLLIKYFPFIQLGVIAFLILIGYSLFSTARKAEQNQVWVGMAKETAHQLGTPLSSLIAWNELMKARGGNEDLIEIEKDINRLETITERFSKIGSKPQLDKHNIKEVLTHAMDYMRSRTSKKIEFTLKSDTNVEVKCNVALFEWVVENLIRNAADAMEGEGQINIHVFDQSQFVYIDIEDTGKGIPKSKFKTVFKPGYTTKKRGWGLGLSLTKRIIENYHGGKIFIKGSEIDKGTIFRIVLNK
ncbi:MAG TPA: HAMP domain-containing sensor histidine kinase [Bacteroidia bacterium]|nr:HAMP domain-containing sensor histidine kinase [Bacteroidia bacterium]